MRYNKNWTVDRAAEIYARRLTTLVKKHRLRGDLYESFESFERIIRDMYLFSCLKTDTLHEKIRKDILKEFGRGSRDGIGPKEAQSLQDIKDIEDSEAEGESLED